MGRSNRIAVSILTLIILVCLGSYWTYMAQTIGKNQQQLLMSDIVAAQASAIERRLSRSLSATDILVQEVIQQGGEFERFDLYADAVLRTIGGVSNLQLAPNGIISRIYPLAGNEKAIGHNLLKDDKRRHEAINAIKERRLTLAGPFKLVQGGIAVIGRNPVFLNRNGTEQFWGFASALIFLEDLLQATELDQLETKGYSFELSRIDPQSGQASVFARSTSDLNDSLHSVTIPVPNASWTLSMSSIKTGPDWLALFGYSFSIVLAALAAWILNFILRQPDKLRAIVKQKTLELEELAFYDHLTGLANRRLLNEQLTQKVREAVRYKKNIAFLYLDLDDFKRINDSIGHDAGDQLLKQISLRLNSVVRGSDLVARLGGDEFGILLLDSESINDISRIAKKLIVAVSEPVSIYDQEFIVSPSIGITMIPADGDAASDILKHADMAMYSAKNAGKRNYRFYDKALQQQALERIHIEHDLDDALNNDQFVLHYQPLVDLSCDRVMGYEALVRWQHPTDGLLFPDRFIGVAEDAGKIIDIGYWVIREACNTLQQQMSEQGRSQHIAVNLSPRQFADPNLLENIRAIVQQTQVDTRLLEVEITESTLMENIDTAIDTLEQLQQMGIKVSIDDFGTGYSSLAVLKRLPVDTLKIDRSFVILLETDLDDRKIVGGLMSMAHALDIKVIAEGIETSGQLQLLRDLGCDYGQGYLFSKPVPLEQLEQPVIIPPDQPQSAAAASDN